MANKINVKLILELKAAGLSQNLIAKTRHISKTSISDVLSIAQQKQIFYDAIKDNPRMKYTDYFILISFQRNQPLKYLTIRMFIMSSKKLVLRSNSSIKSIKICASKKAVLLLVIPSSLKIIEHIPNNAIFLTISITSLGKQLK